jgi:hypothetical protein
MDRIINIQTKPVIFSFLPFRLILIFYIVHSSAEYAKCLSLLRPPHSCIWHVDWGRSWFCYQPHFTTRRKFSDFVMGWCLVIFILQDIGLGNWFTVQIETFSCKNKLPSFSVSDCFIQAWLPSKIHVSDIILALIVIIAMMQTDHYLCT